MRLDCCSTPLSLLSAVSSNNALQSAIQQLDGTPTLIAGIGPGAALAWRWLAEQTDEQAQAISVDFSLEHLGACSASLPQQAAHGHWLAAWNDNPDDASAFVRGQPHNTQDLISDYGTSLAQLLNDQLARRLQGLHDPLPVIELPSAEANDTVTLFYSGDGGWRDLDQQVAQAMAADGFQWLAWTPCAISGSTRALSKPAKTSRN